MPESFYMTQEKDEGGGGDDDDDSPSYSPEQIETRRHMKRRERYHDTKKACYALKHLRPKLLDECSPMDYAQGASDLASEAEFLMALQHPNIIKLRGISSAGAGGFADGPKGYFLIIDRLDETLDARIKRWKKGRRRRNRLASSLKSMMDANLVGHDPSPAPRSALLATMHPKACRPRSISWRCMPRCVIGLIGQYPSFSLVAGLGLTLVIQVKVRHLAV